MANPSLRKIVSCHISSLKSDANEAGEKEMAVIKSDNITTSEKFNIIEIKGTNESSHVA